MDAQKELKDYERCIAFCTAESYDIQGLASFFKRKGFFTRISKDVLHVMHTKKPGDMFFFTFGCFVCWGYKKNFEDKVLSYVAAYANNSLKNIEIDYFYYRYSNKTSLTTHERLHLDTIHLQSTDAQIKLAISYGLAQSIKLEAFEEAIKEVIKHHNYIPQEISKHGSISLSRREILKRIGKIFMARSSINLNLEYLDAPEFFWRHPNLEPYYVETKQFLDIPNRVMALNQKLDVLQELLDILNSQVQHRHSSLLEIIIIVLIAVEIIISLLQFHLV